MAEGNQASEKDPLGINLAEVNATVDTDALIFDPSDNQEDCQFVEAENEMALDDGNNACLSLVKTELVETNDDEEDIQVEGSTNSGVSKFDELIRTKISCPWCDKVLKDFDHLTKHARYVHKVKNDNPQLEDVKKELGHVVCMVCNETLRADANLVLAHFRDTHRVGKLHLKEDTAKFLRRAIKEEAFEHQINDAVTSTPMISRKRKAYTMADNQTSTKSRRIDTDPESLKPKCPYCGVVFFRFTKLFAHAKDKHGVTNPEEDESLKHLVNHSTCHTCDYTMLHEYDSVERHFRERHATSVTVISDNIDHFLKPGPEITPPPPETTPTSKEIVLSCPWCKSKFYSFGKLLLHAKSDHGISNPGCNEKLLEIKFQVQCRTCDHVMIKDYKSVTNHFTKKHDISVTEVRVDFDKYLKIVQEHSKTANCLCPYCDKSFHSFNELVDHAVADHNIQDPQNDVKLQATRVYVKAVPTGSNGMSSKATSSSSSSTSSSTPWFTYKCPWCPMSYTGFQQLRVHASTRHNRSDNDAKMKEVRKSVGRLRCLLCKNRIKSSYSAAYFHFRDLHKEVKPGELKSKPQDFFEVVDKMEEEEDVNDIEFAKFNCPWCSETFSNYTRFKDHALAKHNRSDEKDLQAVKNAVPRARCLICKAKIKFTHPGVRNHFVKCHSVTITEIKKNAAYYMEMNVAHEGSDEENVEESSVVPSAFSMSCPWCSFKTPYWASLKGHAWSLHKKEKDDEGLKQARSALGKVQCKICGAVLKGLFIGVKAHFKTMHKEQEMEGNYVEVTDDMEVEQVRKEKEVPLTGLRTKVPQIKCPWCPFSSFYLTAMRGHAKTLHGKLTDDEELKKAFSAVPKVLCLVCKKVVRGSYHDVAHHFSQMHKDEDKTQVMQASADTSLGNLGAEHSFFHNFVCPWCSYSTVIWQNMTGHALKSHGYDKKDEIMKALINSVGKAKCKICNRKFRAVYDTLRNHFEQVHKKTEITEWIGQFTNVSKEEEEKQDDASKDEVDVATENSQFHLYKCPWCSYSSHFMYNLKHHATKNHNKKKDDAKIKKLLNSVGKFQCNLCQSVFRGDLQCLKTHFSSMHKGIDWTDQFTVAKDDVTAVRVADPNDDDLDGLKMRCGLCKVRFAKLKDLRAHSIAYHPEYDSEYLINRSVEERGLIRCKLCGLLTERRLIPFDTHLRSCHQIGAAAFVKNHGKSALEPPKLLRSATKMRLDCPNCPEKMLGSRQLCQHLETEHRMKQKMPMIIMLMAKKLGIPVQMPPSDMTTEEIEREENGEIDTEEWDAELGGMQREVDETMPRIESVCGSVVEDVGQDVDGDGGERDVDAGGGAIGNAGAGGGAILKVSADGTDIVASKDKENEANRQASTELGDDDTNSKSISKDAGDDSGIFDVSTAESTADEVLDMTTNDAASNSNMANSSKTNGNGEETVPSTETTKEKQIEASPEEEEEEEVVEHCDGCDYVCPKCPDKPIMHSLAAMKNHIKKRHDNNPQSFLGLKSSRVVEKVVNCSVCREEVIHDRIELGYHVWTKHGLDLETYAFI